MIKWLKVLLSGKPHFVIGGADRPYLLRWYLIPRNSLFNIYLHKFLRDDDDRALHDHPWWFVSIMLKGSYMEHTPECNGWRNAIIRQAGSIAFRKATHRHRVELFDEDFAGKKKAPAWTLVFTGRKVRVWGFWCPKGFVPWHEFVAQDDHGDIGKGCE